MKKNLLWMMAAILFCGFVMTACSKDEKTDDGDLTVKTVEVNYSIKLNDVTKAAIQKAYTCTIEYYDQKGNLVSVEPLKYGNSEWNNGFTINTFPGKFGVRVTIAPKADLSGVADNETFDIIYQFAVYGKPSNAEGEYTEKIGADGTVKYQQSSPKALAEDGDKLVDTFFYDVDAKGNITKVK